MQRREFLQSLSTAAPAVAGEAALTAAENTLVSITAEPRVLLYDDGRHAAPLYQFAPPLTPEDFLITVDQLVGSGADTLVYQAGLEGGVALYDSHVAQKWGDNVKQWTHPVWYRAGRHLKQLIEDGHDPLTLLCDRCHEKRLFLIASNTFSLIGGDRETDGGLGRKSDFAYDHKQFEVGEENDSRADSTTPRRFNLLHTEAREERLRVFSELLSRYATDGVEIDMTTFVPYCRFDQVKELAPYLTEWLRKLSHVAREAEQGQGRRKRIYVRVPAHPDAWEVLGYDVPAWTKEKLIDGLVCLPGLTEAPMDQDWPLEQAVQLTTGSNCRVIAGFSDLLGRQLERAATQPMIWAAASNAYARGADGFAIVEYHWTPNGWPWTSEEYETLRMLGHPDMLSSADKCYRVRASMGRQEPSDDWLPGVPESLPKTLEEGNQVEVRLRVSDDLSRRHAEGKVSEVRLRIRLTIHEPSLNDIRVELNGCALSDSIRQLSDHTYRLYELGALHPYGYIYDFVLTPGCFPEVGDNTVGVILKKADTAIDAAIQIHDVDLSIRYRVQRHFEDRPIEY
ncbi:MAG: hypothetical protein VX435_13145 [Planctomycetota bacterium]|nr:hypothetical protein [Planctomycetota bacterium]